MEQGVLNPRLGRHREVFRIFNGENRLGNNVGKTNRGVPGGVSFPLQLYTSQMLRYHGLMLSIGHQQGMVNIGL